MQSIQWVRRVQWMTAKQTKGQTDKWTVNAATDAIDSMDAMDAVVKQTIGKMGKRTNVQVDKRAMDAMDSVGAMGAVDESQTDKGAVGQMDNGCSNRCN